MGTSIKSRTWDKDHTYYADDEEGYYFHTFAQARDYLAKQLIKSAIKNKKYSKDFTAYIHRYTANDRQWQYGFVKVGLYPPQVYLTYGSKATSRQTKILDEKKTKEFIRN